MSKMSSRKSETRTSGTPRKVILRSSSRRAPLARSSWKLASGESLAEFALRFGFLAPGLLGVAHARIPDLIRFPEVR